MMHSQIEKEEIVERYVCDQLGPAERHQFEEHFFGCDECFEKVQASERFKAGISDAVQRGLLNANRKAASAGGGRWLILALAGTTIAALIFAGLTGWIYLKDISALRAELRHTMSQLRAEQQVRMGSDQQSTAVDQSEANIPLVMLQASRGEEQPTSVLIPADARHVVLWVELGPSRYRDFRLEVFSSENRLITSVDHLARGRYGALAASIPTNRLPTGDFHITLTGQDPPPAALAGEYQLQIRRP